MCIATEVTQWLILGLHPANERRRYKVTLSLAGWAQIYNRPCNMAKVWQSFDIFQGMERMSDYAISFHYIASSTMFNFDYFVFYLRPYGIIDGKQTLNHHK